jgi:hypothetical protein
VDANENRGLDAIEFAIESGPQTIQPRTPLPPITDPLIIDGSSQPGFDGAPLIELDGAAIEGENSLVKIGLEVAWGVDGSAIQSLIVNNFESDGIRIRGNETIVSGNYIGTDRDGTTAAGNDKGLLVIGDNNVIGGLDDADRNVISGNATGIWLTGDGNLIQGNYIGTDITGNEALGNARSAIVSVDNAEDTVIGGPEANAGNVISANGRFGIEIAATSIIQGNSIGVGADGSTAMSNLFAAIVVGRDEGDVRDVLIGGTGEDDGNTIANHQRGIWLLSNADGVTEQVSVYGNSIYATGSPILLGASGVADNDEGDGDAGTNRLQNYPELTYAELEGDTTGVQISYRVDTNPELTPETARL